jgi:hypothetical protein
MLATYCFSGRLRTAIHPARRQLLFLCTMRPRPEAARVPGTPARGAPPCMRATSQRAFAPAERQAASVLSEPLHPGQPMLACAQPRSGRSPLPSDCTRGNPCLLACARPRSGRSPLPSDCTWGNPCLLARNLAAGARPCRASQRAPSRNLCTRGNPCLQRVLLRDPCARLYIPCPQCVLLWDPCAWRLHAPRPRAVLQRALAHAVRQEALAPPGCAKLSILCPQCVLLRDPCAQRALAPVYDNSWPQRVIPLDPCVRLLYASCPHARSAPRDPCQKQRAPFRDS